MRPTNLPMKISRAREIALGDKKAQLGQPSKMPGYAFGLPAAKCLRGKKMAEDPRTVCGHCYALSNYYLTSFELLEAHKRRFAGLSHPEWVPALVTLILSHVKPEAPYFRWHDSGDLQGLWHLRNIIEVCIHTPSVHHWLPTHEPFLVREYLELVATGMSPPIPKNLCIRISADGIGCPPEHMEGLESIPTTTTHRGHGSAFRVKVSKRPNDSIECKSYTRTDDAEYQRKNSRAKTMKKNGTGLCDNCRACWNPRVKNVSIPLHNEKTAKYQLQLIQLEPRPWKRSVKKTEPPSSPVRDSLQDQLGLFK
jgi:hypothetical protein